MKPGMLQFFSSSWRFLDRTVVQESTTGPATGRLSVKPDAASIEVRDDPRS